jgi:hypothetical protein
MPRAPIGAQQLGVEPFRDQIRHRHRPPAQQPEAIFLPEPAKAASDLQEFPHLSCGRRVDVGRRHVEQVRQKRAEPLERPAELCVASRILLREGADRFCRPVDVVRERERATVGGERHEPRVRLQELHAAGEPQVVDDRRAQRSERVHQRRLEACRELLVRHAAASRRARLEHQRFQSRARQMERGDERIVAGADEDRLAHVN